MECLKSWSTILTGGKLGALTLSKSTTSTFLIYFLIVLRSKVEATLLVMVVRPLLSAWIKSAMMSDLISLSALLMLATYLLESFIIFSKLFVLIGTNTCFLNRLFVIILSCELFFRLSQDVVNFFNFLCWEIREIVLNFDNIIDSTLWGLSIRIFFWYFTLTFTCFILSFVKLELFQDFLAQS